MSDKMKHPPVSSVEKTKYLRKVSLIKQIIMKKNSDSESAMDVDEEQPVNRHQTL